MFERWGRTVARARWLVLGLAALFVAVGGVWGTGVFSSLSDGGFEDPGSEASRAAQRIEATVGRQAADVVAVYSTDAGQVDTPQARAAIEGALAGLPADEIERTTTYWDTGSPAFLATDGGATFVAIQLAGADDGERMESFRAVEDQLRAPPGAGLEVQLGGQTAIGSAVNDQISEDLARAETLSAPLLLVLLVIVFGSVVAAGLPLLVGTAAVLGSFTVLRLMTGITDVSVFAINIVTILGLGLAIDYALFVVSRFREEVRGDRTVPEALARTMATAGRTVAFSGVTVAVSLAGLALFPQVFLRSMAYGGVAAVLIAMLTALTVLPALLAVLGHRVDAWSVRRLFRRGPAPVRTASLDEGGWARFARGVMRRPIVVTGIAVAGLLVLAAPLLRVEFGGIDSRVLPESSAARIADETLTERFPGTSAQPVEVVLDAPSDAAAEQARQALAAVPGATGAEVVAREGGTTVVDVSYAGEPMADATMDLVSGLRSAELPDGVSALVGGQTAQQVDLRSSLADRLPWTAGIVLLATALLLFLAFGSVVLPLKAVALNALSMAASFGVVVWIFQDGNLADLLGFTPTGAIETTQPILMAAILFGLSMDYEVFLLSRMREQYDRTGSTQDAVAAGLQRSGRIITSAALLLVVVIGAFSTSGISFIMMIGVGMAVAIVIDATVIRMLLVPATMRLLGDAAWWAPGPLRRWWERHGIAEKDDLDDDPGPAAPPLPAPRPQPEPVG